MINGEILSPLLYRRFHFADDQRRDIESFLYRRFHFADDQRRDFRSVLYKIYLIKLMLNNTYCEVGEFCLVLYIETVT